MKSKIFLLPSSISDPNNMVTCSNLKLWWLKREWVERAGAMYFFFLIFSDIAKSHQYRQRRNQNRGLCTHQLTFERGIESFIFEKYVSPLSTKKYFFFVQSNLYFFAFAVKNILRVQKRFSQVRDRKVLWGGRRVLLSFHQSPSFRCTIREGRQ